MTPLAKWSIVHLIHLVDGLPLYGSVTGNSSSGPKWPIKSSRFYIFGQHTYSILHFYIAIFSEGWWSLERCDKSMFVMCSSDDMLKAVPSLLPYVLILFSSIPCFPPVSFQYSAVVTYFSCFNVWLKYIVLTLISWSNLMLATHFS